MQRRQVFFLPVQSLFQAFVLGNIPNALDGTGQVLGES